MGAMGPWAVVPLCHPEPDPEPEELLGYRASLRASLRRLLEEERAPTSDPRVLSLTAHLTRRQAAVEVEEELRRTRGQQLCRQKLVADFFRGVDLHYM